MDRGDPREIRRSGPDLFYGKDLPTNPVEADILTHVDNTSGCTERVYI